MGLGAEMERKERGREREGCVGSLKSFGGETVQFPTCSVAVEFNALLPPFKEM